MNDELYIEKGLLRINIEKLKALRYDSRVMLHRGSTLDSKGEAVESLLNLDDYCLELEKVMNFMIDQTIQTLESADSSYSQADTDMKDYLSTMKGWMDQS